MANKSELYKIIHDFISAKIDLDTLMDKFYVPYSESNWAEVLTPEELKIIDEIHEKIDFVGDSPSEEDRGYGYISSDEYRQWLKKKIDKLK